MTIQELIRKEPFLKINKEGTGIYLIPSGKRGWTSFPVTRKEKVTKEVVKEDGSKVLETIEEDVLREEAVLVSPSEYQGLIERTHVWQDGKVVRYVESEEVKKAKALVEQNDKYQEEIDKAKASLKKHDYISVKISEAVLSGDQQELEALKKKYSDKIAEAKKNRELINQNEMWISSMAKEVEKAKEVIANED